MTQVFFTDDATDDLREAKKRAFKSGGKPGRDKEVTAIKHIVANIKSNPCCGTVPSLLSQIGMNDYRQNLTSYNSVIHDYDAASDSAYILMIIPQMRDFPTHLQQRMLRPMTVKKATVKIP